MLTKNSDETIKRKKWITVFISILFIMIWHIFLVWFIHDCIEDRRDLCTKCEMQQYRRSMCKQVNNRQYPKRNKTKKICDSKNWWNDGR